MAAAAPSFPGMVRWWEEWQLRVLALSSLFLQLFLFVSATFRKYRVPPLLRSCIWMAYLGGDALAIYALATVFNRHRQTVSDGHGGSSGSVLEVMWVPVFLVHLGGQDSITAYNIEDNELWARHAVAMSSQAAVAVYVFWRSWSGGQVPESSPALLLFAAGFLKLGERLWALRRASITRLAAVRSSAASRRRTPAREEEGNNMPLESYVRLASSYSLFAVACREIRHALRDQRQRLSERELARWISGDPNANLGDHLAAARRLAEAMMQMNDAGRMLKVISGVWVEMICYSASRCRGFLHAKSLGVGGEFLTVVWLLLHRMGMEVLADKLQRPELAGDEPDAAVV
uniref:DUF4220 domain-containing protein n=1 Tax=Oryza punctata TaxID=4537 RepID=A0A0E0JXX2_ORYPU